MRYGYAIFHPSVLSPDNGPRTFFYGKGPNPLLWAGSRAARAKIISGRPNYLNYCDICIVYAQLQCGCRPRVGEPWSSYYFQRPVRRYAQSRSKPVNLPKETKFCIHTKKMWSRDDHDRPCLGNVGR
jgi:hypothetical protein